MCTYSLDGVGAGGPAQHWDSLVLLVGVHLQSHLVGRHAEGGDHLADAAGERVSEEDSDTTADIITCCRLSSLNRASFIYEADSDAGN